MARELLDTEAAAEYLGVRPQTLANWRYLGRGPRYYRVVSLVKYDRADLDAWLETTVTEPEPQPAA